MTTYINEEYNVEIKTDKRHTITSITCADEEINVKVGQIIKYKNKKLKIENSHVKINDEEITFECKATNSQSKEEEKDKGGFEEAWQMNVFMSS